MELVSAGMGALLRQTGMSSPSIMLSSPHRLHKDAMHIPMPKLLHLAQHTFAKGKRVVVHPNEVMVNILGTDTKPIAGHACKLISGEHKATLAYFTSKAFHAVGYLSQNQFVSHIFYAGGKPANSSLWVNPKSFAGSHIRFTLFPGKKPTDDFGILNTTLYLNIEPAVPAVSDNNLPDSIAIGSK